MPERESPPADLTSVFEGRGHAEREMVKVSLPTSLVFDCHGFLWMQIRWPYVGLILPLKKKIQP